MGDGTQRGAHPNAQTLLVPTRGAAEGDAGVHAWQLFDGETLVLDVSDAPGPILSTAMLPPGMAPVSHPFLSVRSAQRAA